MLERGNKVRTRPVPVRFDEELSQRLHRAARRMGSNASAVVRFAVIQQLAQIESGTIRLNAPSPEVVR